MLLYWNVKFRAKNTLFGYFGAGIWKCYCHIWNQCPRIDLVANFDANIKTLKFGTKNVALGYPAILPEDILKTH